jgi:cytoskeletal protein CcmA (bactofilin family)
MLSNFKNVKNATSSQQNTGTLYNALTAGSKIIGTVISDGDMRVDGVIQGDVKCSGRLVVGEKGAIKGNIECHSAEIMGNIDGKLEVANTLSLRSTSKLEGEIITSSLMVEPNAVFNGTCSMKGKSIEKK